MIYKYVCSCGKKKTRRFPIGKSQNVACNCGKQMEKVISFSVNFVGDGFTGAMKSAR